MIFSKKWNYDYDTRCECSEDDRCGCSFPDNLTRSYATDTANILRPQLAVGGKALNFTASAILDNGQISSSFSLFDYIAGSYALLVFYVADFSPLCPIEIRHFDQAREEFSKRDVKVVAISVDSLSAHLAWRKFLIEEGGVGNVSFPLVSDISKFISRDYGVLQEDGTSQRATFLIDTDNIIRFQSVVDAKITRSVDETLHVIDKIRALDQADCQGIHCWGRNMKKQTGVFSQQ